MKSDSSTSVNGHRRHVVVSAVLTVVACLYYFALLTDGDLNPFGNELCGLVFNDMLAHLLRGEVTIDPAIIRGEAFIRNGQIISYWGIFSALLRLPLVPFNALYELQIARLSCWIAISGLASLLVATLVLVYRRSPPTRQRTLLFHLVVVGALFAGTALSSLGSAYVYNEPLFWGATLVVAFNYVVLKRVLTGVPFRRGDLLALACLAGLALNCRVAEGVSLCLAMGWMLLLAILGDGKNAGTSRAIAARIRGVIGPVIVLAVFVAICGTINYLRWGSPLTFLDLRLNIQIAGTQRLAAFDAFGVVNPVRLPFAIAYYFLGIADVDALPRLIGLAHLYDGIEPPPSAFFLTDTVTLLLAAKGIAYLFRTRARGSSGEMVLAGVLVAELVGVGFVLAANYLTMRYHMDFVPALSLAAAVGYFFLTTKSVISQRMLVGALLLTIVSVVASHATLIQYKEELQPSKEEARMFWQLYQCARNPDKCPR